MIIIHKKNWIYILTITILFCLAVAFLSTLVLLKLFIPNAHKFGLLDIPNERSVHKKPVARGAGIVFAFVFLISFFIFNLFSNLETNFFYVYIAMLVVYFTGIYDDMHEIRSRTKFIFIILAAIIAYYDGFAIHSLGDYFGYELSLGWFALPFTVFAVVGFTNALNLTDGLDGLASSISIVILVSLSYLGFIHDDLFLSCIPLLLVASLLAFLIFNWYPAKIFMGDSGSLFLGFTIAMLSIYALKYINPSSILFLAAIPLLDTLVVMRRRRQRKQSLFTADKNHLHHILLKFKKDKLFTVASLIRLQILFALIFIQVYDKSDTINLVLFTLLFFIFFTLFDPRMSYRKPKKNKSKIKHLKEKLS